MLHLFLQFILIATFILSTSGCSNIWAPKQQSFKAAINIQPKDPSLKRLMTLTNQVNIEASGEFKTGHYLINNKQVFIQPGTLFKFSLSLPIDNPNVISTENAYSRITTSQPVQVAGVLLPKTLTLEKGQVSGELDFAKVFTALIMNILQDQTKTQDQNSNLQTMILTMNIQKAQLQFRPDAILELKDKKLHLGSQSKMELTDVSIDSDSNFVGKCILSMKFLPNCQWIGKKIDCTFNGGNAYLKLDAQRKNHVLTFVLSNPKEQLITLENCLFSFGKDKRSSATCIETVIHPQVMTWQKAENEDHANFHTFAAMDINAPIVKFKTDNQEIIANFPQIIGSKLDIDIQQTQRQTQFETIKAACANKVSIKISRPTSTLDLLLGNTNIGPFALNKSGELSLSFAKGTAKLKKLRWSNNKKYFELTTSGQSDLSIPQGMSMSMDKDSKFHMTLPLTVKLGSAQMNSSSGSFILDAIAGKISINIDKEIALKGDMDFCLKNSSLLGSHQLAIKAHGFSLVANKNQIVAHLTNCSATIPNKDLQDSVQSQFSANRILNLSKTIFEKKHWRYKNAEIKTVTLHNLTLNKLSVDTINTAKFTVTGDAVVDGTIDKGSLMSVIENTNNYQSKPWQIKANCIGNGLLKFTFVPGPNLSNSKLTYDLNVDLPIPNNVDLDWSQVQKGFYGSMEHGVIMSIIKTIKPIPIKYHGNRKLFTNSNNQFNAINVTSLNAKQVPAGIELSFVGNAVF